MRAFNSPSLFKCVFDKRERFAFHPAESLSERALRLPLFIDCAQKLPKLDCLVLDCLSSMLRLADCLIFEILSSLLIWMKLPESYNVSIALLSVHDPILSFKLISFETLW